MKNMFFSFFLPVQIIIVGFIFLFVVIASAIWLIKKHIKNKPKDVLKMVWEEYN